MVAIRTRELWNVRLYKGVQCDETYKYLTPSNYTDANGAEGFTKRIPVPVVDGKQLDYYCEGQPLSKVAPNLKIRFPADSENTKFENIYDCNYLVAYPENTTADFYYAGFIDNISYINDGLSEIEWTIDYWTTYKKVIKKSTAPVVLDRSLTADRDTLNNAKGQLDENLPLTAPTRLTYTITGENPMDNPYYILYCKPVANTDTGHFVFDNNSAINNGDKVTNKENLVDYNAPADDRGDSTVNANVPSSYNAEQSKAVKLDYNGQRGLDYSKSLIDSAKAESDDVESNYTVPDFEGSIINTTVKADKSGTVKGVKVYAVKNLADTYLKPDLFFDANGSKIVACEIRSLDEDSLPKPVFGNIYDLTDQIDKLYSQNYPAGFSDLYQHHGKLPLLKNAQKLVIGLNDQEIDFDLSSSTNNAARAQATDLNFKVYDSIAPGFKPYYSFYGRALNRDQPLFPNYRNKDALGLTVEHDRTVPLFADGVYKYLFANQHRISAEITNKLTQLNANIASKKAVLEQAKQKAKNDYKSQLKEIVNNLSANLEKAYRKNTIDNNNAEENSQADYETSTANNQLDQDNLNNNEIPKELQANQNDANYKIGTNKLDGSVKNGDPVKGNYEADVELSKQELLNNSDAQMRANIVKNQMDKDNTTNNITKAKKDLDVNQANERNNLGTKVTRDLANLQANNNVKNNNLANVQNAEVTALNNSNSTAESNMNAMNSVEKGNLNRSNSTNLTNLTDKTQKAQTDNTNDQLNHDLIAIQRKRGASIQSHNLGTEADYYNLMAMNNTDNPGSGWKYSGVKANNLAHLLTVKYGELSKRNSDQLDAQSAFSLVTNAISDNYDKYRNVMSDIVSKQTDVATININETTAGNKAAIGATAQGELNAVVANTFENIIEATGMSLLSAAVGAIIQTAATGIADAGKAATVINARTNGAQNAADKRANGQKNALNSTLAKKQAISNDQINVSKHNAIGLRETTQDSLKKVGTAELDNLIALLDQEINNLTRSAQNSQDAIKANYDGELDIMGSDSQTTIGDGNQGISDLVVPLWENGRVSEHDTYGWNSGMPEAKTTFALTKGNLKRTQKAATECLKALNSASSTNLTNSLAQKLQNLKNANETALKNLRDVMNSAKFTAQKAELKTLEDNMIATNKALTTTLLKNQSNQQDAFNTTKGVMNANTSNSIEARMASLASQMNISKDFIDSLDDQDLAQEYENSFYGSNGYASIVSGILNDSQHKGDIANVAKGSNQRNAQAKFKRDLMVAMNEFELSRKNLKLTQSIKLEGVKNYKRKQIINNVLNSLKKNKISITNALNIEVSDLTIDAGVAIINAENSYATQLVNASTSLINAYYELIILGSNEIENYVRMFNAKLDDLRTSSETIVPIDADWYAACASDSYSPTFSLFTQQPKDEARTLEYLKLKGLKILKRSSMKDVLNNDTTTALLDSSEMPVWRPLKLLNSMVVGLPSKGQKALTEAFNNGVYISQNDN